jgi:hypothetical protein
LVPRHTEYNLNVRGWRNHSSRPFFADLLRE